MALYTVDGVYTGIGSVYYTGPDNSYADSSGGFGDDGGGGFDGGGASGDW